MPGCTAGSSGAWRGVEAPQSLPPRSRSRELCSAPVQVAGWPAGRLGLLPVCVLSVCLCLGEVSRGPLPTWLSLCLCRGPKACTLSLCQPVVLSLCVCVSWCCGLCVSVPVWLCYGVYGCALTTCPFGDVCPSLRWCCALSRPREGEDSAAAPPINLYLTTSSAGGRETQCVIWELE